MFPGTTDRVYLNAAAGSITPRWVREAVNRYQQELEEGGDEHWERGTWVVGGTAVEPAANLRLESMGGSIRVKKA